jgi:hypothetical protein
VAVSRTRVAALGVFAILLGSYAYFWQARDWNSASRLMLAYALGDRGTVAIDGLERQTNDRAAHRGHSYSDKGPGLALLALPVYLAVKPVLHVGAHPVGGPALARWTADYWVTLGTSGVLAALGAAMLVGIASRLGCGPRRAALVGLAYGLATPMYVYATLAHGHAATATLLLASFALLAFDPARRPMPRAFGAGACAAYAAVVDLSAGPVAVVMGGLAVARVVRREWPVAALLGFGLGALGPTLILLGYNIWAFGSPLDMGYAHHVVPRFQAVHGSSNPLGLRAPRWELLGPLLVSEYRGLLVYAPIVALAPVGWAILLLRRRWALSIGSMTACLAVLLVNLSYPEWTGGWCTGPRLLTPLLPFAMIAVAAALGLSTRRLSRAIAGLAVLLTLAGFVVNTLCNGVGGRLPDTLDGRPLDQPLSRVVVPLWRGDPVPAWWVGGRFALNLAAIARPDLNRDDVIPPAWLWVQFAPLLVLQAIGTAALLAWLRRVDGARHNSPTPDQPTGQAA